MDMPFANERRDAWDAPTVVCARRTTPRPDKVQQSARGASASSVGGRENAARRLEAAESGPLFAGGGTWMRAFSFRENDTPLARECPATPPTASTRNMSSLLSSVGGQYARTVCLVDTCPLCDSPHGKRKRAAASGRSPDA